MEPVAPLIHHAALLADGINTEVPHGVYTDLDASLDPAGGAVSVVSTLATPAGAYTNRLWRVDLTVITYGATSSRAWDSHAAVHTAILGLTRVGDRQQVRVSSVVSSTAPVPVPGRTAPNWPGQTSTYTLYMRVEA